MGQLKVLVDGVLNGKFSWGDFRSLPYISRLYECPQEPRFHREGDVGIHTHMVVAQMVESPAWQTLSDSGRRIGFLSALLHDVSKPVVTTTVDGRITSKGHSRLGAIDARNILKDEGWDFSEREMVAQLIARHQYPFHAINKDNPVALAKVMSQDVSLEMLCLLAECDIRGRDVEDERERKDICDNIELFREIAQEEGVWNTPYRFADDRTRLLCCTDYRLYGDFKRPADYITHVISHMVFKMPGFPMSLSCPVFLAVEKTTILNIISGICRSWVLTPCGQRWGCPMRITKEQLFKPSLKR